MLPPIMADLSLDGDSTTTWPTLNLSRSPSTFQKPVSLIDIDIVIMRRLGAVLLLLQLLCPCSPISALPSQQASHTLTISSLPQRRRSDNLTPREHAALISLTGSIKTDFFVQIEIGTPPQSFDVVLDTGSANFAVAAAPLQNLSQYYNVNKSATSKNVKRNVSAHYGIGSWSGEEVDFCFSAAPFCCCAGMG